MTHPQDNLATDDLDKADIPEQRRRGRGARSNHSGRFEHEARVGFDDGWETLADMDVFRTTVHPERAKSIIASNNSPDLSFDRSLNPYRGCEHGCSYCYARPTHAFLGHSPGLDFETQLYAKTNAAERLEEAFAARGYKPETLALGAVTDPYQPIEKTWGITRQLLEVLDRASHPVAIVTKSALVVRDLDILKRMASRQLAKVAISVTTLDRAVARKMEPRAPTPSKRLAALKELSDAGVPTTVMVAPIVPGLTDHETEAILTAAAGCGAWGAGYVVLRMPLEIKDLFREWLATEFPDKARRVIHLLQSMHGGQDYKADFGVRQVGTGPYANLIAQRFRAATRKLGLNTKDMALRTDLFRAPTDATGQLSLL
ncbi:MAG: PA0069 family radical SAM protein [Pseudomonadota bacterium]